MVAQFALPHWNVAVIDPPWPKKKGGLRKARPNQVRELDYPTMPVADIFDLLDRDVFSSADHQHTVFLWGIDEFLFAGEQAMEARGYRRHARLVWDKITGPAPAFSVRYTHEYLTWFYKPKFMPVHTDMRGKVTTVFREQSREHSRKPEFAYEVIEHWFPGAAYADVFSRTDRPGWTAYGNQCGHFN